MSKFQVTAAEMQAAIADLQEKNSTFKNNVSELEQTQQALRAQWQGDANNAFNSAFQRDKEQWATFSSLLDVYIQTLQTIKQTYEQAETTNAYTAQNRTY